MAGGDDREVKKGVEVVKEEEEEEEDRMQLMEDIGQCFAADFDKLDWTCRYPRYKDKKRKEKKED